MTGGTDQDHLAVLELVVRGLAHCLPPGPVVQYDRFTQVAHREYVLIGIEKHIENISRQRLGEEIGAVDLIY
jgi:hypothetical protein